MLSMHITIINKKEAVNLKESKKGIWKDLEVGKGSGGMMQLSQKHRKKFNLKDKYEGWIENKRKSNWVRGGDRQIFELRPAWSTE